MRDLLIIFPTYNEEDCIRETVETAVSHFGAVRWETTIVVADSSDRDRTREIVADLVRELPNVEHHQFTDGAGRGLKVREAALARPDYRFYVSVDADLPITMAEIESIVAAVESGADMACASKYVRGGSSTRPLQRVFLSKLGNWFFNLFLKVPVHDLLAGVKAWNRSVNAEVLPRARSEDYYLDAEFLYWAHRAGKRIVELPVHYVDPRALSSLRLARLGLEFARNTYALVAAGTEEDADSATRSVPHDPPR